MLCPICGNELRWNGNLGYFFCQCLGFECCIVRLEPYKPEEYEPPASETDPDPHN
jgi:hypothetical protein